ncbi:MAG: ribonuclease III [Clostridia bacterium]|nr:ribonuclease III [Clostridia bacterium]
MERQYPFPTEELEEKIGYKFENINNLLLALTHSSYSNEMKARDIKADCNERLEFLGDSVLSYITSEYLYSEFYSLPEGDLSRIRASAVCEKSLYKLATSIGLGDYLLLGKGEENTNGRKRPSILADAFEALLAAIYLDGGIENVKRFLLPIITPEISEITEKGKDLDYKTSLQQVVQQERGDILEYVITEESGPAHMKKFTVEARLNGNVIGRGSGGSKRAAEQNAAREALSLFGI